MILGVVKGKLLMEVYISQLLRNLKTSFIMVSGIIELLVECFG